MKKSFYEVIFEVTETCQNGNERRIKKSVFMPHADENGKHLDKHRRIERGGAALTSEHYYNIVYIETKTKTMIFA